MPRPVAGSGGSGPSCSTTCTSSSTPTCSASDASPDLERLAGLKAHVAKVIAAGAAFSVRVLAISGRDLMGLGLRPGPLFGEILRTLLDEVVEEPALNQREALLDRARELAAARP
jgi:hypothetical protein